MRRTVLLSISFLLIVLTATSFASETVAAAGKQTLITPKQTSGKETPLVVIYTMSTCPHCKEAKEYLNANKIPFINHEVDTDDDQLAALMKIYDSMEVPEQKRGVPLFVIGNRVNIQGFNIEKLQNALKEMVSKRK